MIDRIVLALAIALGIVVVWTDVPQTSIVTESLLPAVPSPVASAPDVKAAATQVPQEKKVVAPQFATESVHLNGMEAPSDRSGVKVVRVRKREGTRAVVATVPSGKTVRIGSEVKALSEAEVKAKVGNGVGAIQVKVQSK